jgi:phospholipid/cholesterol/gamma-HCH transport system substrate-binding protein
MSPYRRNVLVGMTVLAALLILGWMIIQFGGSLGTAFAGEKIVVKFIAERGDGISAGSSIRYLGTQVGTVKEVKLDLENNRVEMQAELDADKKLPANLRGAIKIPNLLGAGAIIELELTSPQVSALKLTGNETIEARYVGLGLLPAEFSELSGELQAAIREIRDAKLAENLRKLTTNLNEQVSKAGQTLDSINAVIGTESAQADLKLAITQFRQAVERANTTAANVEKITGELKTLPADTKATLDEFRGAAAEARTAIGTITARTTKVADDVDRRMGELAAILDNAREITAKINDGKGTIGQLVNDGRFYSTLVSSTEALDATIVDIQRYVRQIEEEGITLRLK